MPADANTRDALKAQLSKVPALRVLAFDDERYEEWRAETAQLLDQMFGRPSGETHPCTVAFTKESIPDHFTASRDEMQEYYRNILRNQADLLKNELGGSGERERLVQLSHLLQDGFMPRYSHAIASA